MKIQCTVCGYSDRVESFRFSIAMIGTLAMIIIECPRCRTARTVVITREKNFLTQL